MMAKPIQDPTCGQSRQGEGGQGWAAPAVLVRGWEPHARARGAWSKGALHDEAAPQSPTATSPAGHLPGPQRPQSLHFQMFQVQTAETATEPGTAPS